MITLCERVQQTIRAGQLVQSGDRVLVGVSGGPDSVVLLDVLHRLQRELSIRLFVVHVDHQLREESAADAAFVEQLATSRNLPVTVVRRDVGSEARRRGLSLEDGARRVRYEVFRDVARARTANRLATAHTADDQAETVLMRVLRGAGLTGLTAIPMKRSLDELTIVRPMLDVWRSDILLYLATQDLQARHDASNDDPRFLRNRLRHQLLPWLEESFNPRIKVLLTQLAEQCRWDAQYLQTAAQRHWKRLVKRKDGGLAIRLASFLKQPKALQRQLLRLAVQELQGDLTGFEFRHWQEIERLLRERPEGTVADLPGLIRLEKHREWLTVRLVPKSTRRSLRTSAEAWPSMESDELEHG